MNITINETTSITIVVCKVSVVLLLLLREYHCEPTAPHVQSLPASQQPSMSAGSGGVTLLHELMGLMRRSLTQQAPIREALYQVSPHNAMSLSVFVCVLVSVVYVFVCLAFCLSVCLSVCLQSRPQAAFGCKGSCHGAK